MSSTSGNVPTVVYYCLGDIYSTNNPLLTVLEGDLVTQTLVSSEKAMTLTGAVQWDKVTLPQRKCHVVYKRTKSSHKIFPWRRIIYGGPQYVCHVVGAASELSSVGVGCVSLALDYRR